jgi:imidazolonepropionase-like amidohydrolase
MSRGTEKPLECEPYDSQPTVIEHASVVTMADSIVRLNYSVVVVNGRIQWVGPSSKAVIPPSARRINAAGMYLIPGLADMHVHMDDVDTLLFIANGVTQVREMNGTPSLLSLRDKICSSSATGPMMSVSGPLLAGVKQRWRHQLVETPDSGKAIVAAEQKAGYDAIKVYDGLTSATYAAIVAKAAELGIPVVGHIPESVGLNGVLSARQRSIEHGDQIVQAASRDAHGGGDSALVRDVALRIRKAGSWVTPTIAAEYAMNRMGTTGYADELKRAEMRYADPGMRGWWTSLATPRAGSQLSEDEFRSAKSKEYFGFKQLLVRELDRAGVPMLAGTDTPNPLMVPGFSLIDELVILHRAGLSNYRVLRMSTRDAATFLGNQNEFGTIAPGTRADIVMLPSNPFVDLNALRRPGGVMIRGRWLPRNALDDFLKKSEKPDSAAK